MRGLIEYKIPYQGLKDGRHEYQFKIDSSFFDFFDNPDAIQKADISVNCQMDKSATMLVFDFQFTGTVTLECDRCCDPVEVHLSGADRLIVKFDDDSMVDASDEILVLHADSDELDLSHPVFEMLTLNIPRNAYHAEDKCNAEVIRTLNELRIKNETTEEEVDPRWSGLLNIKNKFK